MKLIIISGRSGSGKSTALQALEDLGFYCIDNLPVALLHALSDLVKTDPMENKQGVAVSIDARNTSSGLNQFTQVITALSKTAIQVDIIYLDASPVTLLKRFSATRRRHPLSDGDKGLQQAIQLEAKLLEPIADLANLTVDTTRLGLYDLRDLIKERVVGRKNQALSLQFQSFGFKHGVPLDADLVYDVRCLPNPYWDPALRKYNGLDQPVKQYLEQSLPVREMASDIQAYLEKWIPHFEANNRSYLTVGIGCTGGQHRSVFLAQTLAGHFALSMDNVLVKHRELSVRGLA